VQPPDAIPAIPIFDAGESYRELKGELDQAYLRVMSGGWYILGQELAAFEAEFASYCGVKACVGTANGLDALHLMLRAAGIGPGDEVIVPAFTFIATWLAVSHCGATPVPVDVCPHTANLLPEAVGPAVTSRTRAIVVVHLFGRPAPMDAIHAAAAQYGLQVFEDAAQAHGAMLQGRRAGALRSRAAAFSFYPAKNLGAFGDGGAVVSNDPELIDRIAALRNYGGQSKYIHEEIGFNSRLDPLQAAFLRVKLAHLDRWNQSRRHAARQYRAELRDCRNCILPPDDEPEMTSVWHQFVIRHPSRSQLQSHLASAGIGTAIHYPVPPHQSPAYRNSGLRIGTLPVTERLSETVLSLPMGPYLTPDAIARVTTAVRAFVAARKDGSND